MFKRIKRWLFDHFLPMWAKETLLTDYRNLERAYKEQNQELERLKAYISGMEAGVRSHRRIVINTTGEVKK